MGFSLAEMLECRFTCDKQSRLGGYFSGLRAYTESQKTYHEHKGILMVDQTKLQLNRHIISDEKFLDEVLVIDIFQDTEMNLDHFGNT